MRKEIRVKWWRVQVCQDHVAKPVEYGVYAVSGWDARILAFALDGGFPKSMTRMEEGHVELAREYTKILGST